MTKTNPAGLSDEDLARYAAAEAIDKENGITNYAPPQAAAATAFQFVTARALKAIVPAEPNWIVHGYVAAGAITLWPGAPKVGKTTGLLTMVEAAVEGRTFAGRATLRTPVVFVSEEASATLSHKLPDTDRLHVLTRDSVWPRPSFPELIAGASEKAVEVGALWLIVDTPYWAGLAPEREKDAGAALEVMSQCAAAARTGLALTLPTHTRKGAGNDGEAIRGSSAFAGAADIIVEVERVPGHPRRRVLLGLSRFPTTPGTLIIERGEDGEWTSVSESVDREARGDIAAQAREDADRDATIDALGEADGPLTRDEIEARLGTPSRLLALHVGADDFQMAEAMSPGSLDKFIANRAERVGREQGWPSWMKASPANAAALLPQAGPGRLAERESTLKQEARKAAALDALGEAGVPHHGARTAEPSYRDLEEEFYAAFEIAEADAGQPREDSGRFVAGGVTPFAAQVLDASPTHRDEAVAHLRDKGRVRISGDSDAEVRRVAGALASRVPEPTGVRSMSIGGEPHAEVFSRAPLRTSRSNQSRRTPRSRWPRRASH